MSKIFAYKPSAYKEGKAYLVIPSGADKFYSFSRPAAAARINPDGDIATMAINVPRIDYTDGGCPSLLLDSSLSEVCGNYTQTYDPNSLVWKLNTKAISNDGTIRNCSISDASGNSYQVRYTTTDDVVSVLVESSSSVQETINIPLDVIGYYSDIWVVADNGTLKVKTNGILRSVNTNITAPLSLTRKDYHDGLGGNSFSGRIKGDIVDDDVTSFNSTATSINEILNNSKLTIR
jgi:hypothetical protein